MSSTAKLTYADFLLLHEDENRYELNEGELLLTPSPTLYHNVVRARLVRVLADFVETHGLGLVADETDFHLSANTVRRPDVAFISSAQLAHLNPNRSPLEGAPTLAIEVISPTNSAADMLEKVHQYLDAGCHAVWVFYPTLNVVALHDSGIMRESRGSLTEEKLFPGLKFTLDLAKIFDEDLTKLRAR